MRHSEVVGDQQPWPPLRIIPLGGLGEIGLNMMIIECGEDLIIVDCGVLFPDLYWLGLDLVLPDFTYLIENQHRIRGLVVTHGHEDHIGAIPFLLQKIKIPIIYCSRFAARLLQDKCAEHQVSKELLTFTVVAGDDHDLGCFNVEFIHVTHSTLETFALSITTPHGVIVHSGDFKFDEKPYHGPASDKKRFADLGKKRPLLLLSDSTNSERCGHSQSESSINKELKKLIKKAPAAVVVALFASNVHRVHQLMDIAKDLGRKVFLSGRSMERYVHIAIEENFLPIDLTLLHPIEEIGKFPRHEVLVLSTGSQGESRSSLLRLAKNENRWLKLLPEDQVILSSRNIPGNEKAINAVVNQLFKLGTTVHYEDIKNVHVSGHAYQEEQLELIKLVKPQYFIPVHGEYRHLVHHARTATDSGLVQQAFIIENGTVWSYGGDGTPKNSEVVRTGRRWVFQGVQGELDDAVMKDRQAAARGGVVVIDCLVSGHGNILEGEPKITLRGFLAEDGKLETVTHEMRRQCESAFIGWGTVNEENLTREQWVGRAAKKVARRHFGVKPLVIVNFIKDS